MIAASTFGPDLQPCLVLLLAPLDSSSRPAITYFSLHLWHSASLCRPGPTSTMVWFHCLTPSHTCRTCALVTSTISSMHVELAERGPETCFVVQRGTNRKPPPPKCHHRVKPMAQTARITWLEFALLHQRASTPSHWHAGHVWTQALGVMTQVPTCRLLHVMALE